MEFPFPPASPGYTSVLIARWLLVIWTLTEVGILITRLRRWKFVRSYEMLGWCVAAGISWFIADCGSCGYLGYDDNRWLVPSGVAAFAVCAAGMTAGLCKVYVEGSAKEKRLAVGCVLIAAVFIGYHLLPSLGHPRELSNRNECRHNLLRIGLALHNYHDLYHTLPPSTNGDEPVSWRVAILPELDHKQIYKQYDQRSAWDDAANIAVARLKVDSLICPSIYGAKQDTQSRWFTAYSMLTGPHTVGDKSVGTSFRDMTDGTSHTLLAVEACGAQIVWTEPRDVDTAKQPAGINLKGKQAGQSEGWMSSYHYGGAHAGLADGTVRFLSADIDPNVLKKLSTIDRNDSLQNQDF